MIFYMLLIDTYHNYYTHMCIIKSSGSEIHKYILQIFCFCARTKAFTNNKKHV